MTRAARAGKIRLHMQERPKLAFAEQAVDLAHRRQEPPVLPNGKQHAGFLAGVERLRDIGAG